MRSLPPSGSMIAERMDADANRPVRAAALSASDWAGSRPCCSIWTARCSTWHSTITSGAQRVPQAWARARSMTPGAGAGRAAAALSRPRRHARLVLHRLLEPRARTRHRRAQAGADAHDIRWLPGAREFLGRVRALGKRLVLVTNAHPTTLAIKDARTQVISHFDAGFSSHSFGAPKEHVRFWQRAGQGRAIRPGAQPVRRRQPAGAACRARGRHRPDLRRAAARQRGAGAPAAGVPGRWMRSAELL